MIGADRFEAVVQPLDFHLDAMDGAGSWKDLRQMRKMVDDLRQGVEQGILKHGGSFECPAGSKSPPAPTAGCFARAGITSPSVPGGSRSGTSRWENLWRKDGTPNESEFPARECTAHIIIERSDFLLPLLEFAAGIDKTTLDEFYRGEAKSRYLHLLDHDLHSGLYVPVAFDTPFYYRSSLVETDVSIGSTLKLRAELESLGRRMGAGIERRVHAMKDFVHAREDEFSGRERDDQFWIKLAYIVLCRLVDTSLKRRCPILYL